MLKCNTIRFEKLLSFFNKLEVPSLTQMQKKTVYYLHVIYLEIVVKNDSIIWAQSLVTDIQPVATVVSHIIKKVSEQSCMGGPRLPLITAFCHTQVAVTLWCMHNPTLDMQDIMKSPSDDNTKLKQFSCHIVFVISDSNFQCGGSEGTWIRYLPLPGRWKSESVNTSNVTVRRHLCDVYSAKFWILHAFTVMQAIFVSTWAACETTWLAQRFRYWNSY